MMDAQFLEMAVAAFATLFVIVDPIGLAPLFVALTAGQSPGERRRIAVGAVLIAAAVLTLFGLLGEALISTIGVGLPAFRISGGLMLFLIALEMLFERRSERRAKSASDSNAEPADHEPGHDGAHDPMVFPLATPLLAGPGAMASMILLTSGAPSLSAEIAVYLCLGAVLGICLVLFLAANLIERALGATGIKLVTRLLGVLLGALAVQFVLDGLADFGFVASRA